MDPAAEIGFSGGEVRRRGAVNDGWLRVGCR